jgi:hypothetical protein
MSSHQRTSPIKSCTHHLLQPHIHKHAQLPRTSNIFNRCLSLTPLSMLHTNALPPKPFLSQLALLRCLLHSPHLIYIAPPTSFQVHLPIPFISHNDLSHTHPPCTPSHHSEPHLRTSLSKIKNRLSPSPYQLYKVVVAHAPAWT